MKNNKKSMIFIACLSLVIALLFFASYCAFDEYSKTAPAMLSWVSLFFSNYIVLVIGVLLTFLLNGFYVAENHRCKFNIGVFLAFSPFILILIFTYTAVNKSIYSIQSGVPVDFENNLWLENIVFPIIVSTISSIGLAMISALVSNSPDQDKAVRREIVESCTNEPTSCPTIIRVRVHLAVSPVSRYCCKKRKCKSRTPLRIPCRSHRSLQSSYYIHRENNDNRLLE